MYNRSNLIRQKRSKQKEYDRKKSRTRNEQFDHELQTIKQEIDMIDLQLQKNSISQ